jgi:MoxR-like ATPase
MAETERADILPLRAYLNQQVIGQEALVLRLLVALLADGY